MSPSLLTVIIPVYNGEQYLSEAIGSVLLQGWPSMEIVVIDDGSTDRSAPIAASFDAPVRCVCQPHGGAAAARNCGIRSARGAYLAFLDADDLWMQGRLDAQWVALQQDELLDMCFGHIEQFYSPEQEMPSQLPSNRVLPGYHVDTLLIRKESFHRVGLFQEELRSGEFIDWFMRARDLGLRSRMLAQVLARRRLHRTNHGILQREAVIDYVRIAKARLDRMRQKGSLTG